MPLGLPKRASCLSALVATASIVLAATSGLLAQGPQPTDQPHKGDVQAGADIAEKGVRGAPPCSGCHSDQMVENGDGQFPLLEGHTAYYLSKQLRDYAKGARSSAVMQPIASALNDTQIDDIAAYYASRPAPSLKTVDALGSALERGEKLARFGDERLTVQGCVNCHGNAGHGEAPGVPYLAGQDAKYIAGQLKAFASGSRQNDDGAVMRSAIANMSDEDMRAVSLYLSRIRPPGS